ncbi:putative nuclease HARBI1 [Metopolophium dirhodum]|uniref:putative nuclease HARBI1 n=1 Tax=Metopolophium dirhodum TaxID=44670 RepID=UPI00298FD908|nr:putative nuclease HARBI1 [Metopolophium dirhodum]XP_060855633.1 putative nuclease HARBI1 [Metopolophium dirhodum]
MQVELVDNIIKNFTRMTLEDFKYLASLVCPKITRMDTNMREAITARESLALTMRFLATGDSFTSLQYLFRISKSTISGIIPEVCDAINESLQEYIKIPTSTEQWLQKANEFKTKWSFPHAIAAMDGKHVVIQAPNLSVSEFYNYKNSFSIVLFSLVDANYNFMYVDVGCQGRISDGGVFKNTTLYKKLENRVLNIPNPCVLQIPYAVKVPYMILGDKAFALNDYTLKPFMGNPDNGSPETYI